MCKIGEVVILMFSVSQFRYADIVLKCHSYKSVICRARTAGTPMY